MLLAGRQVFIVLLSRVILYFDLNLYQPLSKVDENMARAQKRDALRTEKFWFAQALMPVCGECPGAAAHANGEGSPTTPSRKLPRPQVAALFGAELQMQEITILEILQGVGSFKGLVPMIMAYLDVIGTDSVTLRTVSTYLDFIVARAAGELLTPAAWMRSYIRSHPDYKFDSVISQRIAADLMAKCHRIGMGLEKVCHAAVASCPLPPGHLFSRPLQARLSDGHARRCHSNAHPLTLAASLTRTQVPELHGNYYIQPVQAKDAYSAVLTSQVSLTRSNSIMGRAVERYAKRSELMAKRRELRSELDSNRKKIAKIEDEVRDVETLLHEIRYRRT